MLRPICCGLALWLTATFATAHPLPQTYPSPQAAYHLHQVAYHRQVAQLDKLIRLRKAEIASLQRQLAEWEPLDRFRTGRTVMIDVERTHLLLQQAELDLECLEQESFDLIRSRGRAW